MKNTSKEEVTILAGGDMEWSPVVRKNDEIYQRYENLVFIKRLRNSIIRKFGISTKKRWKVVYMNNLENKKYIENIYNPTLDNYKLSDDTEKYFRLKFSSMEERNRYPFDRIKHLLRETDIAIANLETPLSDISRVRGRFQAPTSFADAMKWAGLDIVSIANNHTLDAEGTGLMETVKALDNTNIEHIGAGTNIDDARKPVIVEKNGIKLAFLGYTQHTNGAEFDFALQDRSGVNPLDSIVIKEDIEKIRDEVDFVILSFHWGIEDVQDVHPYARKIAHDAIDEGADIILGHHPHVPSGIELYHGKLIAYSLGNLLFSFTKKIWMDNYLIRITLGPKNIKKAEIIPITGTDESLAQPYPLEGRDAENILNNIKTKSKAFNTSITIRDNIGNIII